MGPSSASGRLSIRLTPGLPGSGPALPGPAIIAVVSEASISWAGAALTMAWRHVIYGLAIDGMLLARGKGHPVMG